MSARGPSDPASLLLRTLMYGDKGLGECDPQSLPDAIRQFYKRLRKQFCQSWSKAAVALVMRDAHRWVLLDGPMPVNGRQVSDFHAYQLQSDLLLDRMEEEEAVAELEFRICVRRLWAEFAFNRRRRDWEYLDVFIYYDMRIERHSAQLGEFGHIELVKAGSKAFVRRLQAPGTPFLYRGTGHWAACRRSGDDEDLASSMQMLLMNFVISSGAEGKIWHVVGETMFFATTLPDYERADFLDAAARLQNLWEFLDGPFLESDEVEDLICYYVDNNLPPEGSIPPQIRRECAWLRSLAEALMVKTIPAVSGFARELANYHPSFDEAHDDFDNEFRFRHYVRYRASRFADQFDC